MERIGKLLYADCDYRVETRSLEYCVVEQKGLSRTVDENDNCAGVVHVEGEKSFKESGTRKTK